MKSTNSFNSQLKGAFYIAIMKIFTYHLLSEIQPIYTIPSHCLINILFLIVYHKKSHTSIKYIFKIESKQSNLHRENQRNPDHEFFVPGFMPDALHGDPHGGGAAERRNEQQSSFPNTVAAHYGAPFVADGDEYGDEINNNQVGNPIYISRHVFFLNTAGCRSSGRTGRSGQLPGRSRGRFCVKAPAQGAFGQDPLVHWGCVPAFDPPALKFHRPCRNSGR